VRWLWRDVIAALILEVCVTVVEQVIHTPLWLAYSPQEEIQMIEICQAPYQALQLWLYSLRITLSSVKRIVTSASGGLHLIIANRVKGSVEDARTQLSFARISTFL
jgi:hypothetical protein